MSASEQQGMNRRRAVLRVSLEMFIGMFRQHMLNIPFTFEVIGSTLPDDAQVIGGEYLPSTQEMMIYLTSAEFEEVYDGMPAPYLDGPVLRQNRVLQPTGG